MFSHKNIQAVWQKLRELNFASNSPSATNEWNFVFHGFRASALNFSLGSFFQNFCLFLLDSEQIETKWDTCSSFPLRNVKPKFKKLNKAI